MRGFYVQAVEGCLGVVQANLHRQGDRYSQERDCLTGSKQGGTARRPLVPDRAFLSGEGFCFKFLNLINLIREGKKCTVEMNCGKNF